MEKDAKAGMAGLLDTSTTQSVKLQRYTITPFTGDYKDWVRFWNQFEVEVDGAKISEISKFNYLLELVKGKPREDILGLPHTVEGYQEAKRILQTTYGKDFKVHKALIKEMESLQGIMDIRRLDKIHEFYNKLARVVRTLTTMGKLQTAQCAVYTLMDKLGPVREIITQTDDKWEEWTLEQLVESLRKYVDRNPVRMEERSKSQGGYSDGKRNMEKLLMQGSQRYGNANKCVYCGATNHSSVNCTRVLTVAARRELLRRKNLCYNCTGDNYLVSECRSRPCRNCGQRHHTSVCERRWSTVPEQGNVTASTEKNLSASTLSTSTLHATVCAMVNGQEVRIMIDTGAGSSYICSNLITQLGLSPIRHETRCIEQMYGTVTRRVGIYPLKIQSTVVDGFNLDVNCINAEKDVLTYLPNPRIKVLKRRYPRLRRLQLSDENVSTDQLPVHIILGAADYQRIRSTEPLVLGYNPDQDPGAEFTMLGWVLYGRLISNGDGVEKEFFLNSSRSDFEHLCSMDVLGLDDPETPDPSFHEDFTEHIQFKVEGFYETRLPWKIHHSVLPSNKDLALARLWGTTRRLDKCQKLGEYDAIMQEQVQKGILEPAPSQPTGQTVHYVPHHPVIREEAESTKTRIVYDCSAKISESQPSLNDCLETGPALQPFLFDILLRNRVKKLCITGDIEKAFHQIRIHEDDRDAQRVLWFNNVDERKVVEYRFTRVIFGAAPSPYILGATLQKHLSVYQEDFPDTIKALMDDTYVDDIQYGSDKAEDLARFKEEATQIMQEGGFSLHKWHSNVPALEGVPQHKESDREDHTTRILGTQWDKLTDTVSVNFKPCYSLTDPLTKRKMLAAINGVYDILGLASPVIITGKVIFSEVCSQKILWDEPLPNEIVEQWTKWINSLRAQPTVSVPRSVVDYNKRELSLHGFSDASNSAVCAAVYVTAKYWDGSVSQNLLVSKARIAPKNTSIPRLELVAALTLARLLNHVTKAIGINMFAETHAWVDSTTVLYWLAHRGKWSQYVVNRVAKINDCGNFTWHYVPTAQNPSDLGTRGVSPSRIDQFWLKGPDWLTHADKWPELVQVQETVEVQTEASRREQTFLGREETQHSPDEWANELLQKHEYWKLLRITAFTLRFFSNCRKVTKLHGPLTTEEIEEAEQRWIKLAQRGCQQRNDVPIKKDTSGIWRLYGRVPDYHPIFLPRQHRLAELVIEHCHRLNLHGGVQSTMNKVRETFWIPQLRRITRKLRFACNHCKRFRAKALSAPPMAALPSFRTEFADPFSSTGVDFFGPIYYKLRGSNPGKAYVVLFTCACTRAIHLKLCTDMSVEQFKRALKEFVARRGAPQTIVSDNAKTFIATKKWLKTLQEDEDLNNYLASQRIKWKFNLSRAPWWGGFFERMVGVVKSCLSKVIGGALLSFAELEETLLDAECFANNRPLCYVGEEFGQRTITPNILIRGRPSALLEENIDTLDDTDQLTRRLRYLKTCRLQLRKRWVTEYLHALEERSKTPVTGNMKVPSDGSMVLIKDSVKSSGKWKLGRVEGQVKGRDGVLRGFKIRTGNGYLVERPVQLVADLEICAPLQPQNTVLNPDVPEFRPRRQAGRAAKDTARNRMIGIAMNDLGQLRFY